MAWEAKSLMQEQALDSDAKMLCIGGSAGTYKTETLLVDPTQFFAKSQFHGILFRTTFPELEKKIIPRSRELYSNCGFTYDTQQHAWRAPWGAVMRFAYLDRDDAVFPHQGAEYTWIGFDESTHRTEFQIRYLCSRLRSPDGIMPTWVRMGTNPGGPGHAFHLHTFLGNACPHCEHGGRRAGVIYKDATWLSDKKDIGMTTQYIFGKWDPNGLLPDYGKQLQMQGSAFAKQLLEGCWRSFEGQYYDIWEPNREGAPMVVPRQTILDKWWWPRWTGSDYGFSGSAAASCLFTAAPNGVVYQLAEYPWAECGARHEDVRTFAANVYEHFLKKKDEQEQPPRIIANYLSPDCRNNRGDYRTLTDQMNEVLRPHGLHFIDAQNDRAGGAMLIYTMLQRGNFVIADTCVNTIRALESRVHDKKEPEKVEKVAGDPLDDYFDACRYGLYSYVQQSATTKPVEMRVAERVEAEFEKDPTTAMFHAQKIKEEEENRDKPQPYATPGARRRQMAQWERTRVR